MFTEIPVEPDAETAREWAIEELSKSRYQEHGPSWLERLWNWVTEQLGHLFSLDLGGSMVVALVIIAVLVGLLILAVRLTVGPVRRAYRARRTHSVFEDDTRSSSEMREAANAAAQRGDFSLAVLERYRAIIRSLEERDLISDRPGVTADEAARETGTRFPDVLDKMTSAAELFDGVRYGHDVATREDDGSLRRLDSTLASRSLLSLAKP
ncbi:MAG: DUF4129 domain-containing protein [Demequinaceae bacterium]|nr:DUF4129 domain-containing protein [Demequinaceae bacterium]